MFRKVPNLRSREGLDLIFRGAAVDYERAVERLAAGDRASALHIEQEAQKVLSTVALVNPDAAEEALSWKEKLTLLVH